MAYSRDDDWRNHAVCRTVDPELFFPKAGGRGALKAAREICASCPVRLECLEYAMDNPIDTEFGVWGGLSDLQRVRVRKAAAAAQGDGDDGDTALRPAA